MKVSMTLYFTVQWFCLISWRLFDVCTWYMGSMNQYDPMFDLKINVGQCDLYFMVQLFCLISWSLFDVWTSLFGIMNQYDPTFDRKIKVSYCDIYFIVQWFFLISGWLFDVWTALFGIMIQYDLMFDRKIKCRSLWPIFHGPLILHYILKTIWCMSILISDYESVWPDVWPKINVGHCDLYFMVHWFCIISWRLFDVWASLFRIMNQYDPTFDLKINVGHCDLYFMVQWFFVISPRLFDGCVSYFQIMWLKFWPQNKYRSTWPIFHGLVILLNIFQHYLMDEHHCWFNGLVWLKDWPHQVYLGQWPMFYGPVILPFHKLKLFLYIKKWRQPGVFVPLRAFALVNG